MFSFTTPLPPSTNSYLKKKVAYSGGRYFVQVYESQQAKEFKRYVKVLIDREREAQGDFLEFNGYLVCEVTIYFARKRSDADNIFKCLLDAFTNGKLIVDDSKIIPRVKDIFIDSKNPRVEVVLYKSTKVGIFADEFQLNRFKNKNCSNCSKKMESCSILKGALDNKTTEYINTKKLLCSKIKVKRQLGEDNGKVKST